MASLWPPQGCAPHCSALRQAPEWSTSRCCRDRNRAPCVRILGGLLIRAAQPWPASGRVPECIAGVGAVSQDDEVLLRKRRCMADDAAPAKVRETAVDRLLALRSQISQICQQLRLAALAYLQGQNGPQAGGASALPAGANSPAEGPASLPNGATLPRIQTGTDSTASPAGSDPPERTVSNAPHRQLSRILLPCWWHRAQSCPLCTLCTRPACRTRL